MSRKLLVLHSWDDIPSAIYTPKQSYWFTNKRHDEHGLSGCVFNCNNSASVVYISDYGFAHIAYCDAHAQGRILETMFRREIERGVWCVPDRGRFVPHNIYIKYLDTMKSIDPNYAKRLTKKLNKFMKTQKLYIEEMGKNLYYDYR